MSGRTRSVPRPSSATVGIVLVGSVAEDIRDQIKEYGRLVGLLFQITDDLLDVTQSSHQLGKTAGKDAASGKATYPALIGIEQTSKTIAGLRKNAKGIAQDLRTGGQLLGDLIDYLAGRKS